MSHHRRGLRRLLGNDELLEAIEANFERADLSERQICMLRYAVKLTEAPKEVVAGDIDDLRELGFEDADLLGLAECVAYYAYANRIANGLGIELE
ncbi:MAG: putative peroxidase-related enzyme [Planctomycetota bacterium]|jgi:uncharacterized peroxidase-related enzyme